MSNVMAGNAMTSNAMTLAPDMEARVRAVADRQGLAPEAVLDRLLESALAQEERQLQETAAALRASMADFEAGRSVSLEDWRAQSLTWIAAHQPADLASPKEEA